MSSLESFIIEVEDHFLENFYHQVTLNELLKRNENWDDEKTAILFSMTSDNNCIKEKTIHALGPIWFPYSILSKFKSFRDYPLSFVAAKLSKVENQAPMSGSYEITEVQGIVFRHKASEDNIRLLRIEELLTNRKNSDLIQLLGDSNDGRYTELEVMGMILLLDAIEPPASFLREVWGEVQVSDNGVTLRKRLKCWGTAIKRWPDYWTQRYNCEIEKIIETETVLGYLIEDTMQEYHLQSVADTLEAKHVYHTLPGREFLKAVESTLLKTFSPEITPYPSDITYEQYLDDWNAWTTSGAASGFKGNIIDGETDKYKRVRINKNALPLFVTKEDIINGLNYNPVASIVMKAEVGKNRIAYSTDTSYTIAEKYLLDKYSYALSLSKNRSNYIAYTNAQRLHMAADILTAPPEWGISSQDIENNDFNQNTEFNVLMFYYQFKNVISDADKDILLKVLRGYRTNKIKVPSYILKEYPDVMRGGDFTIAYGTQDYTVFEGYGGILSGRGPTFDQNSQNNALTDRLSLDAAAEIWGVDGITYGVVGGDDKWAFLKHVRVSIFQMLYCTGMYLPINAEKSYISYTAGEFFRVMYIKGKRRQGYPSRIIHSICSTNPASSQEIDIVNALKSFWSNCSQCIRRGASFSALKRCLYLYSTAKGIPHEVLSIATENGGAGIPINEIDTWSSVQPGIPRFKMQYRASNFDLSWFSSIMKHLRVENIPGAVDSYKADMMIGIRDADARKNSKRIYKEQMVRWQQKHVIIGTVGRQVMPIRLINYMRPIQQYFNNPQEITATLDSILTVAANGAKLKDLLYKVRSDYQLFSDILNRGVYPRFRDKIDNLTDLGILYISDTFRNSRSAYVMQSMLNGQLALSSPVHFSFPADMTFIYTDIALGILSTVTIRTPSEFVWYCDYVRFSVAHGMLPYLSWAARW